MFVPRGNSYNARNSGSLVNPISYPDPAATETVMIGGIRCLHADRAELAELMVNDVRMARAGMLKLPRFVTSANGHVVASYHGDPSFRALIDQADIVDVDGMPLVFATRLFSSKPLRERVATTDFINDASARAAQEGIRFFFLGARPGVAEEAADRLRKAYPGLQVVGTRHGYFEPQEEAAICEQIVAAGTDILWLGLGSPRQESFAVRNRERLAGLAWVRTCGGLFDFCAMRVPRAPRWVQRIGFEWLFRVAQEPARLGGRYFRTNPVALYHLLTKTRD